MDPENQQAPAGREFVSEHARQQFERAAEAELADVPERHRPALLASMVESETYAHFFKPAGSEPQREQEQPGLMARLEARYSPDQVAERRRKANRPTAPEAAVSQQTQNNGAGFLERLQARYAGKPGVPTS